MKSKNLFSQFDEVQILSQNKYGIILDYAYIKKDDTYNYLVDCEEEVITCSENELRLA